MSRFPGKVAVITGGCGGIGWATAKMFLEEGANVAVLDLKTNQDKDISESENLALLPADVSNEDSFSQALDRVVNRFGGLDILINCAGVPGPYTMIQETSVDDFDYTFGVNVRGVFLGIKHASKRMTRGGVIVNVASDAGISGWPKYAAYGASKAAVISLTKYAALELGSLGIRVNCVAPSTVDTSAEMSGGEEERTITLAIQAMPKIMKPEEMARILLFLASEDASMITGQTVVVDGGWTAGLSTNLYRMILRASRHL
ncbi:MAG TPA: SDR family oxidoreductase [Clostridia bacterium]|nr:SDR family oxidoreductase [Clostridia bacterium]